MTFVAEISTGSRPAYWNGTPSMTRVPEWASVGLETIESRWPSTTRLSKPPEPPSATPVRAPDGSRSNVSLLSGAPVRFSNPANVVPATVPPPTWLIDQFESAAGPLRVSSGPPAAIEVVFLKLIELIPPPETVPVPSPLTVHVEATGEFARASEGPS